MEEMKITQTKFKVLDGVRQLSLESKGLEDKLRMPATGRGLPPAGRSYLLDKPQERIVSKAPPVNVADAAVAA